MKDKTRITIVVDMQNALCGPFLQYILDFNHAHPECDFLITANTLATVSPVMDTQQSFEKH